MSPVQSFGNLKAVGGNRNIYGYDQSIQINSNPEIKVNSPQESSIDREFYKIQPNFKTVSLKSNGPVFLDTNAR